MVRTHNRGAHAGKPAPKAGLRGTAGGPGASPARGTSVRGTRARGARAGNKRVGETRVGRVRPRSARVRLVAAAGATALLVTHDQPEALSMGHEVAVLQNGRLTQVADPVTLYRRPRNADLARFVGEAVLLPGMARNGQATCLLGRLPLSPGAPEGPVEVLVRPEQIRLAPGTEGGVRARILGVTFYGRDASVSLLVTDRGEQRTIIARVAGHAAPAPGTDVALSVEGEVTTFPAGPK